MNTCLECPHVIVTAPIPATAKWGGWALAPTVFSYAEASEDVDFPSLELRRANYGESYLKDTFSLTTKGYYTNLGMILGMAFGAAFGAVIFFAFERSMGITFGISFGMIIGLIIGVYMDSRVKTTGNQL